MSYPSDVLSEKQLEFVAKVYQNWMLILVVRHIQTLSFCLVF
jgi:hypothetical protein